MDGDNATGIVFRDILFIALLGFVALIVMMLPHLNPPASSDKDDAPPPGNIIVEIRWPDEVNADVDLWVQAPGDVPVGYSNKGGGVFNLLRDDLGTIKDLMGLNFEHTISRGIPDGEYTVNVHAFRNVSSIWPIAVKMTVRVKASPEQAAIAILHTEGVLRREGEERTLVRFTLRGGKLVPGSVHSLHKGLRSAPSGGPP